MEPQKDDWSPVISLGGSILGGLTGAVLVILLTDILGRTWGLVASLILFLIAALVLYKVVIE